MGATHSTNRRTDHDSNSLQAGCSWCLPIGKGRRYHASEENAEGSRLDACTAQHNHTSEICAAETLGSRDKGNQAVDLPSAEYRQLDKAGGQAGFHGVSPSSKLQQLHVPESCGAPCKITDGAPVPPSEEDRLNTIMALQLCGTPKCPELDTVLEAMCSMAEMPIGAVSLIYNKRVWLVSSHQWSLGQVPWSTAGCPWHSVIKQPMTIACGDLTLDSRTCNSRAIAAGVRCWISAPLLASNGHRIGAVCWMDYVPRKVDMGMCRVLNNCAEIVVRILERHAQLVPRLQAVGQNVPYSLSSFLQSAKEGKPVAPRDVHGRPVALIGDIAEEGEEDNSCGDLEGHHHRVTHASKELQGCVNRKSDWAEVTAAPEHQLQLDADKAADKKGSAAAPYFAGEHGCESGCCGCAGGQAADPADQLLASAFSRQLRNPDALRDGCMLIIDTSKPGWPILYADNTWSQWAGFPRSQIQGQPLQAVLAPCAPGMPPVHWESLQDSADSVSRFIITGVVAVPPKTDTDPVAMLSGTSNDVESGPNMSSCGNAQIQARHAYDTMTTDRGTYMDVPQYSTYSSAIECSSTEARSMVAITPNPNVDELSWLSNIAAGNADDNMASDVEEQVQTLHAGPELTAAFSRSEPASTEQLLHAVQLSEEASKRPVLEEQATAQAALHGIELGHEASGMVPRVAALLKRDTSGSTGLIIDRNADSSDGNAVSGYWPSSSRANIVLVTQNASSPRTSQRMLKQSENQTASSSKLGTPNTWEQMIQTKAGYNKAGSVSSASDRIRAYVATSESVHDTGGRTANVWNSASSTNKKGKPSLATKPQQTAPFDLSFRPMAIDCLDEDALPVGVPSYVPLTSHKRILGIYVARLREGMSLAPPPQPLAPQLKVFDDRRTDVSKLTSYLFPGLHVGQVLGRGSFGTAYLSAWHDVPVVVKVQDYKLNNLQELREAQTEISLGQLLRHPYLVRTLGHGSAELAKKRQQHGIKVLSKPGSSNSQRLTVPYNVEEMNRDDDDDDECAPSKWMPYSAGVAGVGTDAYPGPESNGHFSQLNIEYKPMQSPGTSFLSTAFTEMQDVPPHGDLDASGSISHHVVLDPPPATLPQHCDDKHTEAAPVLGDINASGVGVQHHDEIGCEVGDLPALPLCNYLVNARSIADDVHWAVEKPNDNFFTFSKPQLTITPATNWADDHCEGDTQEITYQPMYCPSTLSSMAIIEMPAEEKEPTTAQPQHNSLPAFKGGKPPQLLGKSGNKSATHRDSTGARQVSLKAGQMSFSSDLGLPSPSAASITRTSVVDRTWSTSSKQRLSTKTSVGEDIQQLLKSAEVYSEQVKAKPLTFPMQLRTLAVLEYCDGGTLQDACHQGWLRTGGYQLTNPPDMLKILRLMTSISDAVAYLHARGVIHADLSAHNVLLCKVKPEQVVGNRQLTVEAADLLHEDSVTAQVVHGGVQRPGGRHSSKPREGCSSKGCDDSISVPLSEVTRGPPRADKPDDMHFIAKVADFGKSKLFGPERVVYSGSYATISQCAPEVLAAGALSPAADVYAMGVLMWQMYTCSLPWHSLSHAQIMCAIVSGSHPLEWPEPQDMGIQDPTAIHTAQQWILLGKQCLSHDAALRPAAADVHDTLQQLVQELYMTS